MKRRTLVPALVGAPVALASTASRSAARQETSGIVGAWLVRETNPPAGGPAPFYFAIAFHAGGTATASGFGGFPGGAQGAWEESAEGEVTFTLAGPVMGQVGFASDSYELLTATVELDGTDAFAGGYETNAVSLASGAPETTFTYLGPLTGTRIAVEAPDPKALEIRPGATPAAS